MLIFLVFLTAKSMKDHINFSCMKVISSKSWNSFRNTKLPYFYENPVLRLISFQIIDFSPLSKQKHIKFQINFHQNPHVFTGLVLLNSKVTDIQLSNINFLNESNNYPTRTSNKI
jgi:hypothetical protein